MTKTELIKENNRLKLELKKIYKQVSLKPISGTSEEKDYAKGDHAAVYASHLGRIKAYVRFALDPNWMDDLTDEEEAERIASL